MRRPQNPGSYTSYHEKYNEYPRTRLKLPNPRATEKLLATLKAKREKIPQDFYGTGAKIDRSRTAANFEMRQVLTRLAVHGFRHAICKNNSYHHQQKRVNVNCVDKYVKDIIQSYAGKETNPL